jgi:hypothetical protein
MWNGSLARAGMARRYKRNPIPTYLSGICPYTCNERDPGSSFRGRGTRERIIKIKFKSYGIPWSIPMPVRIEILV